MFQDFIEFLKQWLPALQLITAVIGTFAAIKQRKFLLTVFVCFFWYAVLNEFFADYYGRNIEHGNNSIVYNVFYPIFFGVLFYLLHQAVSSLKAKRVIKLFYVFYLVAIFVELYVLNIDYTLQRQSIPYIVAGTLVLITILYYFVDLLNSDTLEQVERNIVFWIATAYFFYLLAYVPFKVGQNYYSNSEYNKNLLDIYFIMTLFTNLTLIVGFLWSGLSKEK